MNRLVSRLPGGLAATTVVATSIFSGISGSSAADVATFGRISVAEMSRNGYSRAYAAAVVAAAGAFAALIPPSVTIILYAIIAEQSVSAMIMAGVLPGVMSAVVLAGYVILNGFRTRTHALQIPSVSPPAESSLTLAPSGSSAAGVGTLTRTATVEAPPARTSGGASSGDGGTGAAGAKEFRSDAASLVYAAILFLVVVGGLYGGIFTATEAGAIGAFAALVIAIIARKRGEISIITLLWRSITEASQVTSMIFLLLIGGAIFSYALALSGVPIQISEWVAGLTLPPELTIG